MLAEGAVDGAAEAGSECLLVQRAGDVALVEESYDFVWERVSVWIWGMEEFRRYVTSGLEACDMLSD